MDLSNILELQEIDVAPEYADLPSSTISNSTC
ncbi:class III lanthipeptide [Streptosporangium sp. NPDC000563]